MPNFFLPFATSPEQKEQEYQGFLKMTAGYELAHPTARLFRISFLHKKKVCIAEVGKEIVHWPEAAGPTLAIIARTQLVFVCTLVRGGLSASPILVSPNEVRESLYFDDFPARP